jgi:hypothetical protein
MKELNNFRKFIQENELHEGTWALGSVSEMLKALALLEKLRKMGGVKGSLELDKLDNMLYYVFGDDEFQDAIDRAKDAATDDDRFANAIGDAQARALELYKDEFRDAKKRGETGFEFKNRFGLEEDEDTGEAVDADLDLEENDSVLDEVIEEATIFDKIDNHMKLLSVHMSAEEALEDIVAEFQVISGGTPILAQALRNIVRDNNLTGDPEKYTTTGFKE